MVKTELMGFVRKSNSGAAIKVNISWDAFQAAQKYFSQDGTEYVGMVINMDKLKAVAEGDREVTSICQIQD